MRPFVSKTVNQLSSARKGWSALLQIGDRSCAKSRSSSIFVSCSRARSEKSITVKKVVCQMAKLLIYWCWSQYLLSHVPTLTHVNELGKSQDHSWNEFLLLRVWGLLGNRTKSLIIWEEPRVKLLLLRIEKKRCGPGIWFYLLVHHSGNDLRYSYWEEASGQTQDRLKGLYVSAGLRPPHNPTGRP